ncbi:proteasome assembly chaperone family protein [Methanosarcinales archaeon ex4484_138]|nr:MAG: proteasome assembly chaperone family protein [Methanosarcinales archaeon ex4484_138]
MKGNDGNGFEIITEPIESKNPVLFNGFPGIGLVGNIACQHVIDELDMVQRGSIDSRYFPPIAVLFDGIVSMPVRIYESIEHNLVIVISDIPIHPTISYGISKELVGWAEMVNVREIVPIAGIATMSGKHRVFGSATTCELLDRVKDLVEIFQVGTISGIAGSIMTACHLQNIPAIGLLGETRGQNPEPRAAISVIEALNKIYGLDIDTENLLDQANEIETELQKLADQVKDAEAAPSRKEFPMYG